MTKPIKWEMWVPTLEGQGGRVSYPDTGEPYNWEDHRHFYTVMATVPTQTAVTTLDWYGHDGDSLYDF